MRRSVVALLLLAGMLMGTVSCVVQKNPVSGKKRLLGYSWEEEVKMGNEADPQIIDQYGLYGDDELANYVKEVGHRVLAKSHMRREDTDPKFKNTEFHFRVLNSPVVNAFALPGGYIYVTRGLLAHLNNEAQLAVVLGHEIGHVAARHASQRAFEQKAGQIALVGGAVAGQELFGVSGQNILQLGGQAAQLLFLSYSRDDERESDRLGVEYAAMAGYKASEAAHFFSVLRRLSEQSGQDIPSWMSTHPDPGEREHTIPQLAENWQQKGYEMDEVDRPAYLGKINHIVYGENPREGFTRDGAFYHPDLAFQFPVPDNWQVINQRSKVGLVSKDQDAITILQVDSENDTPETSVSAFLQQEGYTTLSSNAVRDSKFPTYEGVATAQTKDGQTYQFLVRALKYDNNIYRFISYTSQAQYKAYRPTFASVSNGFDELNDKSILNIQPVRITLKKPDTAEKLSAMVPSQLPMDVKAEDIAIINQLHLDDQVTPGQSVKLLVQ